MKTTILKTISASLFLALTSVNAQSPIFKWAKQIGGLGNQERSNSLAVDTQGNIYITGNFSGTIDFNPGMDTFYLTSNGLIDIFICKLDSFGNFQWAKQFGGTGDESCNSLSIDILGNVYTTGFFNNSVDFDPGANDFYLTSAAFKDAFVSKLDSSGNFLWAKRLGGASGDQGNSITVDRSGNIYAIGDFGQTVDFDPGSGVFNLTVTGTNGYKDIFIVKLDSAGNFIWAKSFGGAHGEYGNSIAVDVFGNVFTTGSFAEIADFNPGAATFNLTTSGFVDYDVFISKLDSSGNFVWAKQLKGNKLQESYSIAVDSSGNIFTSGFFIGTVDFNPGAEIFNLSAGTAGYADIFISKLDSLGNFIWAKQLGGASNDIAYSLAVDASGNVYTTGYFLLTADFNPDSGIFNLTSNGSSETFISKLDNQGNFIWAKQLEGTNSGASIAIDILGNVYTTGTFSDTTDFDPSLSEFPLTTSGNFDYDIFIHKMSSCPNNTSFIIDTLACGYYTVPSGRQTYSRSGTYADIIPNTSGCDSTITINLNIYTVDVNVRYLAPVLTADASGASYQWLDCDNGFVPISDAENKSFTSTTNGSYAVIVTKNGCTDTSACYTVLGTGLWNNIHAVQVYPNPIADVLTIEATHPLSDISISVNNIWGQEIYFEQFRIANRLQIPLYSPPGIYFITISSKEVVLKQLKVFKL